MTDLSSGAPLTHGAIDEVLQLVRIGGAASRSDGPTGDAASGAAVTESTGVGASSTGSLSGGMRASVVGEDLIIEISTQLDK